DRLWIATDNGILKQEIRKKPISSWMVYDSSVIAGSAYFANTLIKDGKIYLTRYTRSEGLYVLDANSKKMIKKIAFYKSNEEWNSVISIQMYYSDTLWISSVPGIIWLDLKTYNYGKVRLPPELDRRILEMGPAGKDGKAWMCGVLNNRAVCYDLKERTFKVFKKTSQPAFRFARPKQTIRDNKGDIWFAGHGLQRFDQTSQQFDSVIDHYHGLNKHEDNILHISPDKNGNLWFHAVENGLQCYNIKQNKFRSFTTNNGLPSNIIQCLSPVVKNHLWLGLMGKLVRFNTANGEVLELTAEDGLPDQNYTDGKMFYDSTSGKMFAAMNNYLVAFDPEMKHTRKNKVPFIVDEITLTNNEVIRGRDSLTLGWRQSKLTLKLTSIDFDHESPYSFSYQVDQADTLKIGGTELSLNLEPGKHKIRLWARDRYGQTLTKQLFILIEPPFWKKWWFESIALLIFVCLIYLFIQFRLNRIKKRTELNLRLSEFELKALHAQMNPHFIFNCLNSIKALILYNRNTEATQYLNKFSSLVRQNLDHSRKQFLTLKQNIDYLKQYVEIESLRFTDFKFSIEPEANLDTDDIKIAPMLLQPLIENAIWHGLQHISGEKILNLRFREENEKVICEIEDNGIGINKSISDKKEGHASIGIENIRQRITLLNEKYNFKYKLEITDLSQEGKRGTLVILSFDYL
ncbi:MAG: histidine kinase, partial [Bacteroidia bacterium]|nr:histidine kinase [Bacteroidia bacterium]